jgi:hypothetical protein
MHPSSSGKKEPKKSKLVTPDVPHELIATRGGPTSIQGYSDAYPNFLRKNYIYIVHRRYMYEKEKKIRDITQYQVETDCGDPTMHRGPTN